MYYIHYYNVIISEPSTSFYYIMWVYNDMMVTSDVMLNPNSGRK